MGLLFVILFWLVIFCIVFVPILLIVVLIGKKETRFLRFKRVLLGAICFPIIALFLNIASSSILGTDLGIGDDFHVRIKKGYSLRFTDLLKNGEISKEPDFTISGADSIAVRKNSLYLFVDDEYLLLDMGTGEVVHNISKPNSKMKDISSYYYTRYWTTGGVGLILSILLALAISVFISRKLIRN